MLNVVQTFTADQTAVFATWALEESGPVLLAAESTAADTREALAALDAGTSPAQLLTNLAHTATTHQDLGLDELVLSSDVFRYAARILSGYLFRSNDGAVALTLMDAVALVPAIAAGLWAQIAICIGVPAEHRRIWVDLAPSWAGTLEELRAACPPLLHSS